jgi:uncharacterized protein (DUF1810 family)
MSLDRFRTAQASPHSGFEAALAEIHAGGKRGHWIWYVFPQLAGLGHSSMSQAFGIRDEAEAIAFLRDPELGGRLLTISTAVADQLKRQPSPSLRSLMGSEIDALKLVSSLTLFRHVAEGLQAREPAGRYAALVTAAEDVLAAAAAEGYEPCAYTRTHLGARR